MDEIFEFNASLWVNTDPKADLSSTVFIRHYEKPENSMQGGYKLIKGKDADLNSTIFVFSPSQSDLRGSIRVRVYKDIDLRSFTWIKYRRNSELRSTIEAIAGSFLDSFIEVSPHNVMYGDYDVMEAPRITKQLNPVKDSFTRSSIDYQTLNWGSEKRMIVGRDATKPDVEEFESFVEFDISNGVGANKVIEKAVLRLYYQNSDITGIPLEFYINTTYWSELGITYVNRPQPKELITSNFTINKTERYIDVDVTDIVLKWYDATESNYGLSIKSLTNTSVTFYTKENGIKHPTLFVTMIDLSKSYTAGKAPLDATMFVYGKGYADKRAELTVHSDWGLEEKEGTLYVHRREAPMHSELHSRIWTTRPEMRSTIFIFHADEVSLDSTIAVRKTDIKELQLKIGSTVPELYSAINLDPNAHLHGFIQALPLIKDDPTANRDSFVNISYPEIPSTVEVPNYNYLYASIEIKGTAEDYWFPATIGVWEYVGDNSPKGFADGDKEAVIWSTLPEMASTMLVYLTGESTIDGFIKVYERTEVESNIASSRPELEATALFKLAHNIEATMYIKGSSWMDSTITIHKKHEIDATMFVKVIDEKEVEFGVSSPELHGFIFRRYIGEDDLKAKATFRARDAYDLHCRFGAKGQGGGAYYFII